MTESSKPHQNAFDLFPDLFRRHGPGTSQAAPAGRGAREVASSLSHADQLYRERQGRSKVAVPRPPDMSWLPHGLPEREQCADSKTKHALILIGNEKNRRLTVRILEGFGYLTHTAGSHAEAVDRMARITLSVIIADVADAFPDFHEQLNRLPMTRRRLIFYALIGRELRTLYNLEALTNSVNLVIGHGELVHLEKILEVGFKDYERLFRPILEILHADYPLLS